MDRAKTSDTSEKAVGSSFNEVKEYQVKWDAKGAQITIWAGVTGKGVNLNITSSAELTAALLMLGRQRVAYDFNTGTLYIPRGPIGS